MTILIGVKQSLAAVIEAMQTLMQSLFKTEREGFEPSESLNDPQQISNLPLSTTQPSLQKALC